MLSAEKANFLKFYHYFHNIDALLLFCHSKGCTDQVLAAYSPWPSLKSFSLVSEVQVTGSAAKSNQREKC